MKPTIGRIVHFYNKALDGKHDFQGVQLNGSGAGPYPAVVLQAPADGRYANLLVHAWGGDFREGSVSEGEASGSRYWVWPPRE